MQHIGGKPKVSKIQKKKLSSTTSKRHFTVVIDSNEHGLYVSSSPSSAARKAVTKLCATDKKRKVQFHIREITQKSEKKTYGPYLGYIDKLAKPIELKGRIIRYKPVAKLIKKTGKKNGGMRGGNPCYIYASIPILIIENESNESKNKIGQIIITNNFDSIPPNQEVFKMTIEQFCVFNEVQRLLNLYEYNLNSFDKVIKLLIHKTTKEFENKKDCEIDQFQLIPKTMLFIVIRRQYRILLKKLKKTSFIEAEAANSRKFKFIKDGNSSTYILSLSNDNNESLDQTMECYIYMPGLDYECNKPYVISTRSIPSNSNFNSDSYELFQITLKELVDNIQSNTIILYKILSIPGLLARRGYDSLISHFIEITKYENHRLRKCPNENFCLTEDSVLFIYIHKTSLSIIEKFKKIFKKNKDGIYKYNVSNNNSNNANND